MDKMITRTITTSKIYASTVSYENGEIKLEDMPYIVEEGKISNEKALKIVQKKYGKGNQYVIRAVEEVNELYGMSIKDFMRGATKFDVEEKEE